MTTSYKIADRLYLVQESIATDSAPPVTKPSNVNHLVVIDCSGSMAQALPQIRDQLKRKIPKILRERDTLSIIWFSGKKQFGTLLEAEPVATLTDLMSVNDAIDRWLKPTGLTGFVEPLEEAERLVSKIAGKNKGVFSLFFMSDGCDNQWGRAQILKAVESATIKTSAATFVEYGYYADRPMLTAMAEKAGGSLIFAEDFDRYAPMFENALLKNVSGALTIDFPIGGDVIGNFAFSIDHGSKELVTYGLDKGSIMVPADLKEVWYLAPDARGKEGWGSDGASAMYAALSLFATRMKPDIVLALLRQLGDVAFIDQFGGCFGKQKYTAFQDAAKDAVFNDGLRCQKGFDRNAVPKDNAFTLVDLLRTLASDEGNTVMLDHPAFRYNRIGKARVEQEVDGVLLKFEPNPMPDGYPITSLVLNEDRPNISFKVRKDGKVSLPLPPGKLPAEFETHIFRNYTVIKDGLVNIQALPCMLTLETSRKLVEAGVVKEEPHGMPRQVLFDLMSLPIINRAMVKSLSAKEFFEAHYDLLKAKARQKVLNGYVEAHAPKTKNEAYAVVYGAKEAQWLRDHGITEGGFNPRVKTAAARDYYMGKELKVSLKGLSSLPSLAEAKEALKKRAEAVIKKPGLDPKTNAGALLMAPYIDVIEKFFTNELVASAPSTNARQKLIEAFLRGAQEDARTAVRKAMFDLSQMTFCLIVGQTWFTEFSSIDENTMTIDVDGKKIECKVEMKEIQVEI